MDMKKKERQSECGLNIATGQTDRQKEALKWEKPTLENVTGRVMAQPYIRFT